MDSNFEDYTKEKLANTLREFYPSVRQSTKEGESEGKSYAKQSLINIRTGINKHLQLPLNNKMWELMQETSWQ